MFDLQDDDRTRVIKGLPARIAADEAAMDEDDEGEGVEKVSHPLDTPESQKLHAQLIGYYQSELDRQNDNRILQAIDEDYYDSIQWTEEEAAVLRERGQAPIAYNVLSTSINWIIGSEKRGRSDFKVLPRGKSDAKPAQKKTQLLKYLSDVNHSPFNRSRAFEDAVKVGIGWTECGVTDDDDCEPVYDRYESWRNMLWDSTSLDYDLKDARYVTRTKWCDLDICIAMFPDREDTLTRAAVLGDSFGLDLVYGDEIMDYAENDRNMSTRGTPVNRPDRRRVRMIETWYTKPVRASKLVGGRLAGQQFEPNNPHHTEAIQAGQSIVAERMMMKMHCAILTVDGLCWNGPSPYRHNSYPFTPIFAYRKGRDGLPYGVIRSMVDIQDDINKRASKAQFILASNQIIMEEGAVENVATLLEEAARPDGVLQIKPNKRFEQGVNRELAASHLQLMQMGISMIQQVSGVTDEQMGRTTNAKSGVAIQARQEQGAMSTSKLFENLRFAFQIHGQKLLSLTEQYFSDAKEFRITDQNGAPEYVDINDGLPENDITREQADFIISEEEWRATLRQAQLEQLLELMTRFPPDIIMAMLDLIVDAMDFPQKDELVKRIRAITGQRDPDAEELTPEEQQAEQAKQAQAQYQQQLADAQLRKLNSETMKNEASAQSAMVDMANKNVSTQQMAVEAAQVAMMTPGLLPVADTILKESGFVGASDEADEQARLLAQQQPPQQPPPQQPNPMQGGLM